MSDQYTEKYWAGHSLECPKCGNQLEPKSDKVGDGWTSTWRYSAYCYYCFYAKETVLVTKPIKIGDYCSVSACYNVENGEYLLQLRLDRDKLATRNFNGPIDRLAMSLTPKKVTSEDIKKTLERALEESDEKKLIYFESPTYASYFVEKIYQKIPNKTRIREFLDQGLPEFSEEDVEKIEWMLLSISQLEK